MDKKENAFEKHKPKIPEWLLVDHPDFPKYFHISILDKNGNVTSWFERLPEHMRSKFP